MNNPCTKCIVQAACQETCEPLVEYIDTRLLENLSPILGPSYIAALLRMGIYEIHGNIIRREFDGETMYYLLSEPDV